MRCFYHNDLDGQASAAIVYQEMDGVGEYIEGSYANPPSIEDDGEPVYVVDLSFDSMRLINPDNLVWIDHHISAIQKYSDVQCRGIRRDGTAACELTWEFFHPDEKSPAAIRYIGDMDIWRWKYAYTEEFIEGLKSRDTSPSSLEWKKLFVSEFEGPIVDYHLAILRDGKAGIDWRDSFYSNFLKNFGHSFTFHNHACFACNIQLTGSKIFDSLPDRNLFEVLIVYAYNGKSWSVSLYTEKQNIDVSKIAQEYGGGGHRLAAGFSCLSLPFEKN